MVDLDRVENTDFTAYSGIIISGGKIMLTTDDQEKYKRIFQFIKTAQCPILGICLGHQLMGLVYGAKVAKGEEVDEKEAIEIMNMSKLFTGIGNHEMFREEHTEYVMLPQGFELLAKSSSCVNESMRHLTEEKYSVQFHPEISGENGKRIIKNFVGMCGK